MSYISKSKLANGGKFKDYQRIRESLRVRRESSAVQFTNLKFEAKMVSQNQESLTKLIL